MKNLQHLGRATAIVLFIGMFGLAILQACEQNKPTSSTTETPKNVAPKTTEPKTVEAKPVETKPLDPTHSKKPKPKAVKKVEQKNKPKKKPTLLPATKSGPILPATKSGGFLHLPKTKKRKKEPTVQQNQINAPNINK